MKKEIQGALLAGVVCLLWLASAWAVNRYAQADDSTATTTSLPEVDKDVDEFYAHVDEVNSATELTVTILDVWEPRDKLHGPRWPKGEAKVEPTKRAIILEDISVPDDAEQKEAALDFISKTLKESGNEVICTGSSVSVDKQFGDEIICITGYVYVKEGFTLNRGLVRLGLATSTNPVFNSCQEQAGQKKLGIWRNEK
jgi:hypothetical protein